MAPAPSRLFHGWIVVAAGFAVLFMGFGTAYTFAAFFAPLQEEFGAMRSATALIFSIAGAVYFLLGAVSGPLADRHGPRWIVFAGMVVLAAGLMLAGRASQLWQVYVGYGLGVGIGIGLVYVPVLGAVQRWFLKRRGQASGIAVAGIGLGTLFLPPLAAVLIETAGWRGSYFILGLATLLIGGGAALLMENDPERRGLRPDGEAAAADAPPPARPEGMSIAQAIRTRPFWLMYGTFFFVAVGLFVPFVHLVPYARDRGVEPEVAVILFSLIGIGSTAGRFFLGGIADRLGRRQSLAATFLGMAFVFGFWLLAESGLAISLFALLFGLFYGGFVALSPPVIADYFGPRNAGGLIGMLYSGVAVGTLIGPPLTGLAFDLWQSYTLPIAVSAGFMLLGASLTLLLGDPSRLKPR
ncbi:MAG: MFS transporter [Alphaproteobacteria bacterium]|nr:MFS transporter [Alphaproteobacteria bacterium]